ncbi:MAG: hypothetical protein QGG36_26970 [Pirellulaceae bacterium]|jgi:hypothetical protein|nr:hypothetical protein [Pirellulaceae bacterium]MDP7019469.1 hypothetical protein [Pirellulaceae bacterium]
MATDDSTLSGDLSQPAEEAVALPKKALPMAEPLDLDEPSDLADDEQWEDQSDAQAEFEDEEFEDEEFDVKPSRMRSLIRNCGAVFFSMLFHLVMLIVLGLMMLPEDVKQEVRTIVASAFERPEELEQIELEEPIKEATEVTEAVFSSAPVVGDQGAGGAPAASTNVSMSQEVVENFTASEIKIGGISSDMPSTNKLISAVPDGALGDPRAIVGDYEEAFDRITQEILWQLDKSDVLVIWAFDQSESMKDDQQEIRDRIERVYKELGLVSNDDGDRLLTAVTSYGAGHLKHTRRPTADLVEIRQAINQVPIDPSGKEMMCEAVLRALAAHRDLAKRYQIMLVLVTDESGDRPNNVAYLEQAIAAAKATKTRIYALGRESVFGYPFVHMRWQHPQTQRWHWLPVDRGPETGFVEQLQTNGFRRRYDAFSSGFAPYELARMARETNGVFFMLPSTESALVRGAKRKYQLDAVRAYRPDLRPRIEVIADRDKAPLRTFLWKVINDLNPYNKQSAKVVEMRMEYSINMVDFTKQARLNQQKAILFIKYLGEAQKVLEEAKTHREQEADPRWQANYDLIYAQIVAYQARLYEYGVALEDFMKNPAVAPPTKSPNLRLVHWDLYTTQQTRTEESKPYIERSTELFKKVIENHPGTPWAARAEWELKRGFGLALRPDYHRPLPKGVKVTIPIPKL